MEKYISVRIIKIKVKFVPNWQNGTLKMKRIIYALVCGIQKTKNHVYQCITLKKIK